jgi:hypothetical protein
MLATTRVNFRANRCNMCVAIMVAHGVTDTIDVLPLCLGM